MVKSGVALALLGFATLESHAQTARESPATLGQNLRWSDVVQIDAVWPARCNYFAGDAETGWTFVTCGRAQPAPRQCRLNDAQARAVIAVLRKTRGKAPAQGQLGSYYRLDLRLRDDTSLIVFMPQDPPAQDWIRFSLGGEPRSIARADWVRLRDVAQCAQ